MESKKLAHYDNSNDHMYCTVLDPNNVKTMTANPTYENKITEMLVRIRRIDTTLMKNALAQNPQVPPKPEKNRGNTIPPKPENNEAPPPRPPRDAVKKSPHDEKILRRKECAYLLAQIENIRHFIDVNIDDDFEGRIDVIFALDTLSRSLTFH